MKKFLFVAVAMMALPAVAEPRDVFHRAALNFAVEQQQRLIAGQPVGVVPAGVGYGQTMNPSSDQLKALGYLKPDARVGGDVRMEFQPPGCQAERRSCELLVKTLVGGVPTVSTIRLR